MEFNNVKNFLDENRAIDETYFLLLSVILAYGLLQTAGTGLGTEKPVVTVISTSMCPALQVGDILTVRKTEFESIETGDIIVYDVPDHLEFSVNGEEYKLEKNGSDKNPVATTDIGRIRLIDVQRSRDRTKDLVELTLDDQRLEMGGSSDLLMEGKSYQIKGNTISIDYATSLPFDDVPIVHRVIEKNNDYVETKGDNNKAQIEFESRVRPGQIHGKTFFRIPRLGLVKILAMDFIGFSGDQPFVFDSTPTC